MDEQSARESEKPDEGSSDAAGSGGTASTSGPGNESATEPTGAEPAATEDPAAEPAPTSGGTTAATGPPADDATQALDAPTPRPPDAGQAPDVGQPARGDDQPAVPGPDPDATVTVARPGGDPDATVTVTRPASAPSDPDPDPDPTVTVPAGPVPEPTQIGPAGTAAWPGPPPQHGGPYGPGDPYGSGAWSAGAWSPPGQPLPPYGAAGAGWPGAPQPIRRRNGKPLAILGVVLLLAVVAGVVFLVLPPGATTAVRNAADAARGWTGVSYRGEVRGPGGAPVDVDMTVGPNGDKSGTLTRSGGGRAEFAESGGVQAIRANAAWWTGAPQGADKGRRLAGTWLRDPAPETTWLAPLPLLSPSALADDLAPANGSDYEDAGDQQVDGVAGRVVTAADQRVVVADDRDARLLSVVPAEASDPSGLRVGPAAPDRVAAIDQARSTVASAGDYTAAIYDPADVDPRVVDAPPCSTPTCVATAVLTNTGGLEARGFVNITADGRLLNRYPFTLKPKANATFTANFANPSYATGRDGSVYIEARVFAK